MIDKKLIIEIEVKRVKLLICFL